jgi:hypothetical protein
MHMGVICMLQLFTSPKTAGCQVNAATTLWQLQTFILCDAVYTLSVGGGAG